jgi:uncharacterized protein YqeY
VLVTLTERIQAELREAMKSGQRERLDALRLIYSSLQKAEKDAPGEFGDEQAMAVLRRERKQRLEAAEAYDKAGQDDRAARERADLPVIEEFLPAPLSEQELTTLVDAAIADTGAATMKDMGRVMGLVTERSGGRADGRVASALVRDRLSA